MPEANLSEPKLAEINLSKANLYRAILSQANYLMNPKDITDWQGTIGKPQYFCC
ncbi:hypothetical protein CRN75_17955 [Yersinia frederiksenii]|nr:hypothetical protein CRN75_17955 [Yersinia frederiksenii]